METRGNKIPTNGAKIAYRPGNAGHVADCSERVIRTAIKNRELAVCHIGNGEQRQHVVILVEDLRDWLRSKRIPADRPDNENKENLV